MSSPTDNTTFARLRNGETPSYAELIDHLRAMSREGISIGDVNALAAGAAASLLEFLLEGAGFAEDEPVAP